MNRKHLAIHLNDHLAGARAGLELVRRMLRSNRGSPLAADLERIRAEIEEDKRTLERIMDHAGIRRSRVKETLGLLAERVGRLKPNGDLMGYSPLSRLLELEGLLAGITVKRSLWVTLSILWREEEATPDGVDLDELRRRADEQLRTLDSHRAAVVEAAFRDEPLRGPTPSPDTRG